MIVQLWVEKIIDRKKTFQDVPRLLKDQVKQLLIKKHFEYLIQ